jgi:signal transduction histidine kinase
MADERKLMQIMYNLLSNAVKFTPDGGTIRISASRVNPSEFPIQRAPEHLAAEALQSSTEFVQICVLDTGVGVKPEVHERIFDPFEQADGSPSRRYKGTGLGLHLTRRLVELHGGWIWVESEGEGKGSQFCLVVPVQNPSAERREIRRPVLC